MEIEPVAFAVTFCTPHLTGNYFLKNINMFIKIYHEKLFKHKQNLIIKFKCLHFIIELFHINGIYEIILAFTDKYYNTIAKKLIVFMIYGWNNIPLCIKKAK